jgi:catalase-peroxidase
MLKNVIDLTTRSVMTLLVIVFTSVVSGNPAMAQNTVTTNDYWWPNRLDLKPLRNNSPASNPLGANFNYAE